MPKTFSTEGIILRRDPHRDFDLRLKILTPDQGKIFVRAISAQKPGAKLRGHLEPFMHTDIFVAESRTIDIVAGSSTLAAYNTLRSSLPHNSVASMFTEVVDQFTEEGEPDSDLFSHVLDFFAWLNKGPANMLAFHSATLKFLALLGYHVELYQCHQCKRQIENEQGNKLHFQMWSVECSSCKNADEVMRLSVDTIKTLRFLDTASYDSAVSLKLSQEQWAHVHTALSQLLRYHMDYPLRSEHVFLQVAQSEFAREEKDPA